MEFTLVLDCLIAGLRNVYWTLFWFKITCRGTKLSQFLLHSRIRIIRRLSLHVSANFAGRGLRELVYEMLRPWWKEIVATGD